MVAVVAPQVRKQEHERKRQRTDDRGNPSPDFEAAPSTFSNPAGKKYRKDRTGHQQCEGHVGAHLASPNAPSKHKMELVAWRLAVKSQIQTETAPNRMMLLRRPPYQRTEGADDDRWLLVFDTDANR
jgi:hypothetical protein